MVMARLLIYAALALMVFSCVHNGSGEGSNKDTTAVDSTGFGGMQADSGTGLYNTAPAAGSDTTGDTATDTTATRGRTH
jgi:hypothetical protein